MKKSMYTKLRDRVAYAKATGDDLTPEQIANVEAVLAIYEEPAPSPPKPMKKTLTHRTLMGLKNKARSIPFDTMDGLLRKFGARTFPNGEVVFIIYCRMPGSRKPTRRKLGRFPEMSLDDARTKAEEWLLKIRRGIDPQP